MQEKNKMFHWRELYISYVNLNHRTDRLISIEQELERVGLTAVRFEAIKTTDESWNREPYKVMFKRSRGAIGCWLSQVEVMRNALQENKDAMVLEDDLIFCTDIKKRLYYIENFLNKNEWDVCWLGGTVHIPAYWHTGYNKDLKDCDCVIKRDAEHTEDGRMLRTYGAFSTHAYIVNKNSIEKIISMLDAVMHEAMGIDWAFIKIAPKLKCFMFLPGCIKQYDNKSDIGNGMTIFSGFSKLNGTIENSAYWWQDRMEQFDCSNFKVY